MRRRQATLLCCQEERFDAGLGSRQRQCDAHCRGTVLDAERAQLADYLAPKAAEREEQTTRYTLETLDRGVTRLVDAVERGGEEGLAPEVAARTWEAIQRLQKALKKAGHPKPTHQAKRPAKPVLEGQGDLL